jgi:hypothetical protein
MFVIVHCVHLISVLLCFSQSPAAQLLLYILVHFTCELEELQIHFLTHYHSVLHAVSVIMKAKGYLEWNVLKMLGLYEMRPR